MLAAYKISKMVERKIPFIGMLVVCEDGLTVPQKHLRRSCMARKALAEGGKSSQLITGMRVRVVTIPPLHVVSLTLDVILFTQFGHMVVWEMTEWGARE